MYCFRYSSPQVEAEVAVAGENTPEMSFNQTLYGSVPGQLFDSLVLLSGHVDVEADLAGFTGGGCLRLLFGCLLLYHLLHLPLLVGDPCQKERDKSPSLRRSLAPFFCFIDNLRDWI